MRALLVLLDPNRAFIGDSLLRARPPELALAARPAATGMAAQRGSDGPADAGRAAGARDHAARRVGM